MSGTVPTGTVTMLFADVQGSTQLLRQLGTAQYGSVLGEQRRLQRSAYGRWNGHELGTEGDSFFVVFSSARDAVNACAQAQRELAEHPWPAGAAIRVRMGLHTGEPEAYEDGYVGLDVHLAARVAATAHGGQVVLSDSTARLVAGQLPEAVSLRPLGAHRLKDIAEAQRLHQLVAPGLPQRFPPLRSLGTATNLPRPAHSLVGRDREVAELTALLSAPDTRLLTLTGPGGSGKTRLALPVAAAVAEQFPDGVYFVSLAAVTDPDVMWTTIAEAMGLTGESKAPPTFFDHLAGRRLLLVLDNLEQLPDAGAEVVSGLLAAGPDVAVLATSRRPLHVGGEQEYAVETLELPPAGATVERAQQTGAVALFVSLARLVRRDFELETGNVADVVALCRRLDGLPLALELAAARSKLLGPRALLERLDPVMEVAVAGSRLPERQQTVRATVAWSYQLLRPQLQAAFRSLGVLAEGADFDAVTAVTGVQDPVELLAELVDASLVRVDERSQGSPRLRLLETIRGYALEQLEVASETDQLRRRHAGHYLARAEAAAEELRGPRLMTARETIETDLANLREALAWTLPTSGPEQTDAERVSTGLRLCTALSWFWYTSGYVAEGRGWAQRASALASGQQGPELASVLHTLAILLLQQGENQDGRDILAKCLRIWRRLGDQHKVAMELNSLGVAYRALQDEARARELFEESIATARTVGDPRRLATALANLGVLEVDAGRADRAIEIFTEAEAVDRELGDEWGVVADQTNRVGALLVAGRPGEGQALLCSMAARALALGDIDLTVNIIELFAACSAAMAEPHRAARLSSAAATLRKQSGIPLPEPDLAFFDRMLAPARDVMSRQEWAVEEEIGRRWSAAEALEHAQSHSRG